MAVQWGFISFTIRAQHKLCLSFCPVYFEDTLLAVWRHGWQRRRHGFSEVLEETTDHRKIYRLVQTEKYDMFSACLDSLLIK